MKFKQRTLISLTFLILTLSACGGEATATQSSADSLMTAAVGTMVDSYFKTQTAMATPVINMAMVTFTPYQSVTPYPTPPILSSSPTYAYFSATPAIFYSPTPTGTRYTPTVNPASLAFGCNNLAFIRDVTVPAGTVLQKNQDFTKTWKVQNTGTCDWMYQYQLVLLSGDAYGGSTVRLQKRVVPWSWSEVSVDMTAPKQPGTYTSYWRMATPEGNMFGATLVVSFVVADPPTNTPIPTSTNTKAPTSTNTTAPTNTETPTSTFTETPTL